MLTQQERPEIAELLVTAVALVPSPRQALVSGLVTELRGELGEGTPRMLVERALDLCEQDDHNCAPPALVQLLTMLLPGDPVAAAVIERLRTPLLVPAPRDPFDAVVLANKLPFLERDAIRDALRKLLARRPTQPLIVVNGARRSGKSYIAEFIDHVLRDQSTIWPCRISIEPRQGASVGPAELAGDMVTLMGGDPRERPQSTTNLDRWTQEVANWVIATANGTDLKWWFVLDGFSTEEARPDTWLLITKLANSLTTGINAERHRLVLLDFDRAVLPVRPGLINDKITGPIPHSVVKDAVATVLGGSGGRFDVAEVSAMMVAGLSDPVTELPELGERFVDLIASVERVAGEFLTEAS